MFTAIPIQFIFLACLATVFALYQYRNAGYAGYVGQ